MVNKGKNMKNEVVMKSGSKDGFGGWWFGFGKITVKYGEETTVFFGEKHWASDLNLAFDGIAKLKLSQGCLI